jgi:hypothetical protein
MPIRFSRRKAWKDGGFEIEIILWEKPKSNVFALPIEDAQDLDFFDQPKPSAEEIPEGTVRPESVIGSYARYHKTKVNHRVGATIYATGKACHIYRPNEVRIGRRKFGQCSLWQGLVAHLRTSRIPRKRQLPVQWIPLSGNHPRALARLTRRPKQ